MAGIMDREAFDAKVLGKQLGQSIPGIDQAERFFEAIGLGQGSFAPVGRFGFGFLATAGLQKLAGGRYAPWAYDEEDRARPWRYGPGKRMGEDEAAAATSLPWWMLPTVVGFACGALV